MTSFTNNASRDLPPLNKLPSNGDNEADSALNTQEAQDALSDNTELDTAVQNNAETLDTDADTDANAASHKNEVNKEQLAAKNPEAKIKMQALGPDVVVATLETDEPDSQPTIENVESEFFNKKEPFFQEATDTEVVIEASSQESTDIDDVNELKTINPNEQENINKSDQQIDTAQDSDKESGAALTHTEQQDDQEDPEEEVKEKKEAKLESYKQFVAEQFSNKKVDYPEVRVRIEANALPSKMYFIMNILSAIIASYGLVTNSAAVVIGAMLVAMMLGPITGIALAIIDHRMPLLRKSLFTVIAGVSLVVLVGFIVGWLHKEQPLTLEILSRTQPTSMDLMIALAGGTAGAYAMVSPHLSVAVVGVAVATALVPPLAASGILFANGEMQLGLGALLLAFTNIIAIQFTNALVLWLLGFRRLVDDDYKSKTYLTFLRRNAVTLLLLGGLGAYLTINLQTNAKQQVFESSVKETINSYFSDKGNVLTNTQFDRTDGNQVVRAVIRGETTPSSYDVRQIETIITQDMVDNFPDYLPIKLQLRYIPVQVIESHPLIQDKLDKTDVTILTN
ncbi:TIGR00341 family protein [Psychrobacter sp.]|uniref:TIGR00341 family protein n=1 Tax=Psychrobacter sp. TaxID=56811 RepID=UPI003BB02E92